ncbi:MAG: Stf0 family sulfotransferase [Halioglobus sp.]|nr:Stf0 family sulfotransferase [Halioglobus sp.]
MHPESVKALDADLYPAPCHHQQEVEDYFDGQALRPLTPAETDSLGELDAFFVAFSNRSGSTLLTELLNQSGLGVPPRAEVFNSDSIIPVCAEHGIESFTDYFLQVTLGWVQRGRVGFKIGPRQLFWLTRAGLLPCFGSVSVVNATRHDRLAQAVSLYIARTTGQWHSDMAGSGVQEIPYDPAAIARALRDICRDQQLIEYYAAIHGAPLTAVAYEELMADPGGRVGRVYDFLQVPAQEMQPVELAAVQMERQRSDRSRQLEEAFRREFALG